MEIELYSKLNDPLQAIERLGTMFAKSGMFGCDRVEAGQILALICLCERKSPTEIDRNYDIVNGKLRKKAMAAFADFRARGGKVKWLKSGDDGKEARAIFTFEENTVELAFTIENAQQQNLIRKDSAWTKTPGNMLRARLVSNALGMLCPEIFAGEDVEMPTMPEKSIELTSSPKPANVIEVSAPKQESTPPPPPPPIPPANSGQAATAAPPPVTAPAAEQKPAGEAPKPQGALPDDTVAKLEAVMVKAGTKAADWLVSHKYIEKGKGIETMSAMHAKKILQRTEEFLAAVQRG